MVFVGCGSFSTTQHDRSYSPDGKPIREISTRVTARTFFDAKSSLAKFKAMQTDKTQSAVVGSLDTSTSGTNAIKALELMKDIVVALPK